MKTMEEKAAEVVARWRELHPGGLSVEDLRAAKDQLINTNVRKPHSDEEEQIIDPDTGKPVDWALWGKNMRRAIEQTEIILQGVERGNKNKTLARIKVPVTWIQDIAVAELEDWPGWWAVVDPTDWMSFCGEERGKENAIKAANKLIEMREKK